MYDPNKDKIIFYTNDCAVCGKVTFDSENKIRNIIREAGYKLEVRECPLFVGWKMEADQLNNKLPFFYNYNTKMIADFEDIIETKGDVKEINQEILSEFLKQ